MLTSLLKVLLRSLIPQKMVQMFIKNCRKFMTQKKINFDGYAQEMAHSKARNKRFQKSAHLLKTNVFKSSYGALFCNLLG